jgi:predicted metal-dependent peptidase
MARPCRALENAVVRLLRRSPFFGHLLIGLKRRPELSGSAAGITICNNAPTLAVNEPIFASLPQAFQEALLEHCLRHLLHLHPSRRKERNHHDWDIACDLAINPSIDSMPPEATMPAYFSLQDGLAAEEYYQLLVDPFDCGNLSGSGVGKADRNQGGKTGDGKEDSISTKNRRSLASATVLDNHEIWDEADTTPLRLAEEMVKGIVREACRKCDNALPAELRPLIESMLAPPVIPWKMILRQFVATAGRTGRKSSWQRENRRFSHTTPGCRKEHRLNLLVGIDVSDSTNAPELREEFAAELLSIARGREANLTVLYANSSIQRIESFRGNSVRVASYHGGGFTDLRPVFEHARTMHPRPAAVVYLTDGIGPAPERMEFPTLWVLTQDGEKPAPWGVELRMGI